MVSLIRAEWTKAIKNYKLTSFLVWVFPVSQVAWYAIIILLGLFVSSASVEIMLMSAGDWTKDMVGVWNLVITFPFNVFGRMLPLAFMAVVFAGEYQWSTWKNIVPRSRRWKLILAKYISLTGLLMLALILTSLISGLGQVLAHAVLDKPYGPELTGKAFFDFLTRYSEYALLGSLSLLILAGFAALSALLSRSMLGTLLIGFAFAVLEPLSLGVLGIFANLFNKPEITNLYMFTPSYHLDNALSWFTAQQPLLPPFIHFTTEFGLGASLAILAGWIALLIVVTIYIFQKQDITS